MNTNSEEAVEYTFKVLAATYGAAWERSLAHAPLGDVKSAWANSLSNFTHSKDAKRAIIWALHNLPERVPNCREFLTLCRQAPVAEVPQLEAPKADPERMKAELQKLAPMRDEMAARSSLDVRGGWAKTIVCRRLNGESITPTQYRMAIDALQALGIPVPKLADK